VAELLRYRYLCRYRPGLVIGFGTGTRDGYRDRTGPVTETGTLTKPHLYPVPDRYRTRTRARTRARGEDVLAVTQICSNSTIADSVLDPSFDTETPIQIGSRIITTGIDP
jgi:hypothetical protein